ncbi:hypothetical protein AAZV13_17G166300 [Glycine max]
MCLVAAAAALCAFIAPATVGSGIPEVKAYLNGVDAQNILAPSTLFVKVFLQNNMERIGLPKCEIKPIIPVLTLKL